MNPVDVNGNNHELKITIKVS